jgi:protein subunit release factor A
MNEKDLKIEVFKSGGPGGQHKNKRFMAVRLTHVPTGLVAVSQEHRSQALNKETAFKRLRDKLTQKFAVKKKRIATRKTAGVKEKTLRWKKRRSLKKNFRRGRFDSEG